MSVSRTKAMEYGYQLLSTPRAHLRVHLKQTAEGVSLLYGRRVLTKVYLNRSGMNAAMAMAEALGIEIPAQGRSVSTLASTGLLHRVLALSALDYRRPEAFEVAAQLLDEARDMQRGASSEV